jgi:hypothetical protein
MNYTRSTALLQALRIIFSKSNCISEIAQIKIFDKVARLPPTIKTSSYTFRSCIPARWPQRGEMGKIIRPSKPPVHYLGSVCGGQRAKSAHQLDHPMPKFRQERIVQAENPNVLQRSLSDPQD